MSRRLLVARPVAGAFVLPACWVPSAQATLTVAKPYDFDGDGRQELVASAPGLTVDSLEDAGGVVVLPGTAGGPAPRAQLITGLTLDEYPEDLENGRLGAGLASADFNGDGHADLVIPTSSYIGYGTSVGVLSVIPGSPRGLDLSRRTGLSNPGRHDDDPVGLSDVMVAGDFTGDGYPDLAVGVPAAHPRLVQGESYLASGEVLVFAGSRKGLVRDPVRVLERRDPAGGHQDWDSGFGSSLGAGDLDGDGRTDLVVGSSGGNGTYGTYPGSVTVCPGAAGGPTWCRRLAHAADYAGTTSFAVGRVTGSARPDLVVATPDPTKDAPGSVHVLQLEPTGVVTVARTLVLAQSSRGVPGGDEPGDAFGGALALADLDRDGFADLVVGSPGENDGRGRVTIVHGGPQGWRTHGNRFYSQDSRGVPGTAEAKDGFGRALTLLDHDGDGRLDLDVGAPGEQGTGSVTTLRGRGKGFTTKGAQVFGLAALGVKDPDQADFGDPLGR